MIRCRALGSALSLAGVSLAGVSLAGCEDVGESAFPDVDASVGDTAGELDADGATLDATSAPDVDALDATGDVLDTSLDAGTGADMADVADTTDGGDGMDSVDPPPTEGRPRYPSTRRHSPLTPIVVENLRAVRAGAPGLDDQVLAKIGDSITVSANFLHCFAGNGVVLDGRDLTATVAAFDASVPGGTSSWDRESLAATVGWSTPSALAGAPNPIESELAAISPRFASVMFGTNDIQLDNLERYANDMLEITDTLLAAGVIPILSSIPPRDDSASADQKVPHYNAVVRAIARARQVPFVDFHRELLPLPDHGLGGDDLHPSVLGAGRGCELTAEGLAHGYNVRNLLVLEALDRVRRTVIDGEPAPDAPWTPLLGIGTAAEPIEIDTIPFGDVVDTSQSSERSIDVYAGMCSDQNESGPEVWYTFSLNRRATIRGSVHDRGDVDIDIHLLDESGTATGCLERDNRVVEATLEPGTYHVVLDTFVSSTGDVRSGEALFVLLEVE